ncbi:MAG: PhoPQ-activated pathogenicity-like protein PqaA type [Bacteroidales bacterium]|nr:PhoPQ-activated pathogenicity-like protein PqaA type [Bacteroidales bacterium]MBN2632330.1 PhoPQ-activated pathogenicity-like protein PqaA type [Bacteroidales bacterium]
MKRFYLCFLVFTILMSGCSQKKEAVNPDNALSHYLEKKDRTYSWELKETIEEDGFNTSILRLVSQEWRGIKWIHQLTIISPAEITTDCALLFIDGGSLKDGEPKWKGSDNELLRVLAALAVKNKAIVATIGQVPNQPLFDDLTEDELISFTLHNFRNDRDYTWPLLFPMTKSAVRAMDAVIEFAGKNNDHEINRFVVSGASKRGWTTWLTGAFDKRVTGVAPMVIDVLNMPVNLDYQKEVWGDYSIQIQDYVRLGLAQDLSSPDGKDLAAMIDPYSYRKNLSMPKLIINGTNDEYWPVDAIKNYLDELPGEKFLYYEPNAGHDLGGGEGALNTLSSFFYHEAYSHKHPVCSWEVSSDTLKSTLLINTTAVTVKANLWSCTSPDRDFRNDRFMSTEISNNDQTTLRLIVEHPESGYKAFYVELIFSDPAGGSFSQTTRMFVADDDELYLN